VLSLGTVKLDGEAWLARRRWWRLPIYFDFPLRRWNSSRRTSAVVVRLLDFTCAPMLTNSQLHEEDNHLIPDLTHFATRACSRQSTSSAHPSPDEHQAKKTNSPPTFPTLSSNLISFLCQLLPSPASTSITVVPFLKPIPRQEAPNPPPLAHVTFPQEFTKQSSKSSRLTLHSPPCESTAHSPTNHFPSSILRFRTLALSASPPRKTTARRFAVLAAWSR
jgi:hypothetical protein